MNDESGGVAVRVLDSTQEELKERRKVGIGKA
jgi:hypothetical protein